MTDVYVAYARQDRERLRVVGELLRQEGWDSWMDPAEPKPDLSPIADLKLGWSKAVLVLWSDSARRSEYVRSEAATGLYKNKLIQARIDGEPPPRPFDELDAVDLSRWNGDPGDPNWQRLTAMLRNCAGDPVKPPAPAPKRPAAQAAPPPQPAPRKPEPPRPTPPPIQFDDPPPRAAEAPQASRFVEPAPPPPPPPLPPPPRYDPPPASRFVEPAQAPPSPPPYEPPPRYAEPPPPPPRYEPRPQPRYAEAETTRYADRGEMSRGPRLAESVYRVPPERRDEQLDEPEFMGRRPNAGSSYLRRQRSTSAAPIVAAVVLIGSGVGLWLVDPFGWRVGGEAGQEQMAGTPGMPVQTLAEATTANAEPATGVFEDSGESAEDWRRVERTDAAALRDHVSAFPRSSTAETARSTLRVLDAQAWVKAVTADSETAYRTYLAAFPKTGEVPGAMTRAAEERLASLGAERSQAIEEIQRGLASLQFYDGATTGKADDATAQAIRAFSQSSRKPAPALASATPRDLRAFAEAVRNTGAQPKASAAVSAAVEADRQRIAQAEAASMAAARAAVTVKTPGADSLAEAQQSRIAADAEAWAIAEKAGSLAGYQSYLAAYPTGARAASAEAAIARLNRPAPFSLDQLPADTKAAVEAARRAQTIATQRASAARQAAQSADNLKDGQTIVGADGDKYVAQISGGAPNGLGVRTRGGGPNSGDRYRGEMRNGQASGVGVYEFADNPGNASAKAARYEGEHSGDVASGHGVMHWKSGDSLAGSGAGGGAQARGVLSYSNGQRYEGEMANGNRQGLGVVWAADGSVIQAGRWAKGELVEPAKR